MFFMNKFIFLLISLTISSACYTQSCEQYFVRGNSKFNQNDHLGAITEYTKAIKLNPSYTDAYYWRGCA